MGSRLMSAGSLTTADSGHTVARHFWSLHLYGVVGSMATHDESAPTTNLMVTAAVPGKADVATQLN